MKGEVIPTILDKGESKYEIRISTSIPIKNRMGRNLQIKGGENKMTLQRFREILKVAEEIAVTSISPQDEVLDYFRNNGINATPEMAFEFVDEAVGRFEEAQVNF